jgi:hypothetical protein
MRIKDAMGAFAAAKVRRLVSYHPNIQTRNVRIKTAMKPRMPAQVVIAA